MRNRNKTITVRLTEKELAALDRKVHASGLNRESFLRYMIEEKEIKEMPPIEFFEILQQICQINNNLNQIAVKANKLNFIDAPEYRRNYEWLQEQVGRIIRGIYS